MSGYRIAVHAGTELPADYRPLIYSKWLRSLRYGNDYFKLIDPAAYYRNYHAYISAVLHKLDCVVRLAVLADDADVVLGFSVSRGTTLDFVHVHRDMRRQGIGTRLVPDSIEQITHVTKTGLTIWGSKYGHWRFNPFA